MEPQSLYHFGLSYKLTEEHYRLKTLKKKWCKQNAPSNSSVLL